MKKFIRWTLSNGLFAGAAYLWIVRGHESAGRFLICMAWFMLVVSFFALSEGVIKERIKVGDTKPSVPLWLDFAYDCCFVGVFVVGNHPVTAIAYLFHSMLTQAHYSAMKRRLSTCRNGNI